MADKKEKEKSSKSEMKSGSVVRSSLDHYVGRSVDAVIKYAEEDSEWAIRLEGGAILKNYDGRRTVVPTGLEGATLAGVEYGEQDIRVKFANGSEVTFAPTLYAISDKRFDGEMWPGIENDEMPTPPEPPPERTQDGPSPEFFQAQKKQTKKGGQRAKERK